MLSTTTNLHIMHLSHFFPPRSSPPLALRTQVISVAVMMISNLTLTICSEDDDCSSTKSRVSSPSRSRSRSPLNILRSIFSSSPVSSIYSGGPLTSISETKYVTPEESVLHDPRCVTGVGCVTSCPHFIRQHFAYLCGYGGALHITLSAFYAGEDDYAQACKAICIAQARVDRLEAECQWAENRCAKRKLLTPPSFLEHRVEAYSKLREAKRILESAKAERWEKVDELHHLGRF